MKQPKSDHCWKICTAEKTLKRQNCEMIAASGGEVVRGRQVTATTTHVLFGEYFGGEGVNPEMRALIEGKWYNVTSVLDKDGLSEEQRIELKVET